MECICRRGRVACQIGRGRRNSDVLRAFGQIRGGKCHAPCAIRTNCCCVLDTQNPDDNGRARFACAREGHAVGTLGCVDDVVTFNCSRRERQRGFGVDADRVGDDGAVARRIRRGDDDIRVVFTTRQRVFVDGDGPATIRIHCRGEICAANCDNHGRTRFNLTAQNNATCVAIAVDNFADGNRAAFDLDRGGGDIDADAGTIQIDRRTVGLVDCNVDFIVAIGRECVAGKFGFPSAFVRSCRCDGFLANRDDHFGTRFSRTCNDNCLCVIAVNFARNVDVIHCRRDHRAAATRTTARAVIIQKRRAQ